MLVKVSRPLKTIGFTLIEILVVIFIISIVTSVALLSIGHNENKRMETFANELTQVFALAEEQAMLQPTVLGIAFADDSFQFLRYKEPNEINKDEKVKDADGKTDIAQKKGDWVPFNDAVLGKHFIPPGFKLKVRVKNTADEKLEDKIFKQTLPQIIISTNGDITPFTIEVSKKGKRPRHIIIGDADGHLTQKSLS